MRSSQHLDWKMALKVKHFIKLVFFVKMFLSDGKWANSKVGNVHHVVYTALINC